MNLLIKATFLVISGVVFSVVLFENQKASSQVSPAAFLSGWAWSDNIGWVSLSCDNPESPVCTTSDYKVTVDSNGNLLGWAWSDNIGWIKFNPSGPYPESPNYSAKIANGKLQGWIRACGATINNDCDSASRNDGWDGWIKLSGADYGLIIEPSTARINGFAWGSDVIGWLSFSDTSQLPGGADGPSGGEQPPGGAENGGGEGDGNGGGGGSGGGGNGFGAFFNLPLVCDFQASPSAVRVPKAGSGSATLSWNCNLGSMTPDSVAIDQSIGSVNPQGSKTVNLSQTTAFTLTAEKFGVAKIFPLTVPVNIVDVQIKEIRPE